MTSSLQVKNGIYYVVLNWYQGGKRRQKWVSTKLQEKGNKREASRQKDIISREWEDKISEDSVEVLFCDYLYQWLTDIKFSVEDTTYSGYKYLIDRHTADYFKDRGTKLYDLTSRDIQDFYNMLLEEKKMSPNTLHHYHVAIHSALKHAVKMNLIKTNPSDNVTLPKKTTFHGNYYTEDEMVELIKAAQGTRFEPYVVLASVLGMRRGEIGGLRWSSIDFDNKCLFINGTMVCRKSELGRERTRFEDRAKNESSIRAYPLNDEVIHYLKHRQVWIQENMKTWKSLYDHEWDDFVCVDYDGTLIKPDFISCSFAKFLEKNGLKKIRFHDLRHTNATLMLAKGIPMQDVQKWLGHKSMATTAKFYSHVMMQSKITMAETMQSITNGALDFGENDEKNLSKLACRETRP